MLGQYYYHEILRKTIISFGTIFNDIHIRHRDGAGKETSDMRVPLAYGPMQKFLARLEQQPDLNRAVQITLPRMSFETTNIAYDATRKGGITQTFKASDGSKLRKVFMPVPYNVGFELNILVKLNDDALQIVEQILPTFNPQYTITIKPFATEFPTFKEDIPIIINGVGFSDDFEGTLEQRRTIIYTLDFEMKVCFYGAINTADIIRTGTTNIFLQKEGTADSDVQLERITTVPNPLSTIGLADSDFGFTNTIDLTFDSG